MEMGALEGSSNMIWIIPSVNAHVENNARPVMQACRMTGHRHVGS